MSRRMAKQKPWIAAACICEKVLVEKDNVNSLVRIIDTVIVEKNANAPAGAKLPPLTVTVYVSLKAGTLNGQYELSLGLRRDGGGEPLPKAPSWPVAMEGGVTGTNISVEYTIAAPEFDLYWFDVLWDGEVLTSIPLLIKPSERATSESR